MKAYETVFVLKPDMEKEAMDTIINNVKSVIEAAGEVEGVDEWGKRKLAYTIANKYTEGYYVLVTFKAEPSVLDELNHRYLINDNIIRDMIVARED
ncbi:30S ribosomal protein S6 [Pseudoramibacter sp.]|jgi:small subunit ribosomal protein S6|uniref:30S ribosomal protein S6 n=1 Tax=Pseudoramibacter sp. TaxID=2034862 RepID=UPI0025F76307|nr:30S ribosomal protein S6 [Pseudoramibacter sp.]MCH4071931.1 30S ribosomal protein S6 [Pseudoramibacter sp.]MCH4105699.1 30S ribosomal protein S6 [Pseudoramibacter sp.]